MRIQEGRAVNTLAPLFAPRRQGLGNTQNIDWYTRPSLITAFSTSVFLLWGSHAQAKAARVPGLSPGLRKDGNTPHRVLTAPHPSPLSAHRGFFGCRHFNQANAFLEAKGRGAIGRLEELLAISGLK